LLSLLGKRSHFGYLLFKFSLEKREGPWRKSLFFSTWIWFFMACFTFSKLLFGRAYNSFHKAFLITPLIRASKAICYINSSILSIFSLDLFRYARVDSSSAWMTSKSFLELLFAGMLYWNSLLTCNEGCRCRLAYTPFLATFHSYAYRVLESLRFLAWSGRIYKWSPSYIGQIDN
jgi:hypothetical protein